jgi:hypothetical protein
MKTCSVIPQLVKNEMPMPAGTVLQPFIVNVQKVRSTDAWYIQLKKKIAIVSVNHGIHFHHRPILHTLMHTSKDGILYGVIINRNMSITMQFIFNILE